MKPKVTLFVNGRILCRDSFCTTTEGSFDNVTPNADPESFDLSEALVVNGDIMTGSMDINRTK